MKFSRKTRYWKNKRFTEEMQEPNKNGTGKWKKKIMPSDEVRVDFVILFLLVMYFIADIYLKALLKFISKNVSCIK